MVIFIFLLAKWEQRKSKWPADSLSLKNGGVKCNTNIGCTEKKMVGTTSIEKGQAC